MNAWLRIPLQLATLALLAAVALTAFVTGAYYYAEPSLPSAEDLQRDVRRFQIPMRVYSRDGRLMQQYGEQKRTPIGLENIPERLVQAVVAAEDDRFWEHPGIDLFSTLRAVFNYSINTLTNSDERIPGGSTITQQIARTTNLLSRDYALGRKVKEIFLAYRLEAEFSKEEIIELYLNTYEFGQRSFGVVAAARTYFDKELRELTLGEIAIIAGIPRGPSIMNPYNSPERAGIRRAYVLRRMLELGHITPAEREAALTEPIISQTFGLDIELSASYVAAMVYEWCQDRFGKETCDTEGLKVTTTLDSRLQRGANAALRATLETYDRNHGYRGPIGRVELEPLLETGEAEMQAGLEEILRDYPNQFDSEAAVVLDVNDLLADVYLRSAGVVSLGLDSVAWAKPYIDDERWGPAPAVVGDVLSAGDIVRFRRLDDGRLELFQVPAVEGALVSVDPMDGAVVALSGGYSFELSAFNRASQAMRQPGSSFKPFFYLSALASGYTLASLVNDAPYVEHSDALERTRSVGNFTSLFRGEVSLRFALKESINTVADRVIRDVGARYAANYVERFGYNPLPAERNASLALGSLTVTPLTHAGAYAILANGGYAVGVRPNPESAPAPYFVQRVEDAEGNVLYDASRSVERVCPEPEPGAENSLERSSDRLIDRKSDLFPPLRCAERVESPQRIYLITSVLEEVILETSGTRARQAFPERTDLAGKTGTTNDARDAWFAGFNADIVAVARVGFDDDSRPLGEGEQGGRTAIPAWIDFMKVALDGMPNHSLPRPPGIVERRINPATGEIAADCNRNAEWEIFLLEDQLAREPGTACSQGDLSTTPDQTSPDPLFQ